MIVDLTVEIGPLLRELGGYALAVVLFTVTLHTMGKLFGK